jgi:putative ABC transport system permease protein
MAEPARAPWTLPLRLARRELRGGLKGFRIFLACLALGVAAIAGVGSVASSVTAGIAADARVLLGGDLALRLLYRPATAEQQTFLMEAGTLSETREMRAMARPARSDDGSRTVLVELKAVDRAYPLYGTVRLAPDRPLAEVLAFRGGVWGAAADVGLAERLGLALGDRVRVGEADYELRALIESEPDRGADVFSLGPRLMLSLDGLAETGLMQPGSLIEYHYRLKLPADASADTVTAALNERFPNAGWRIRGLTEAAPGVQRFVDRTSLFLTLVGLSALLVGGVGVSNAVRSYLESKTATVATLKCLGAPGGLVFRLYLAQILFLALGGIALGLVVGALAPLGVAGLLSERLGITARLGPYPGPLLLAAAFGLLTALGFSLWPLARARDVPAASLFRNLVSPARAWPRWPDLAAVGLAGLALAGLAVATATDRGLAAWFVLGAAVALLIFRLAGLAIRAAARRANEVSGESGRGRRSAALRLALANLYRPGAPTVSVVLSLGLGLTVLVAVALIEGNLKHQIGETMPEQAPSFYFIDIQPQQVEAFEALVASQPGVSDLRRVPMLRGRITALDGVPAAEVTPPPDAAWVLRGDRGITWSATVPEGSRLVAGEWWPADYDGPPLISLEAEIARAFGLTIGDTITVNVLGREITGTIANLRELDWSTLTINFVMVFSPGLLESAPQTHIATVRAEPEAELALQRAVADAFANVSAIRVKEALEAVGRILSAVGDAIRATAAITLAAGVLVLAGAIAAGHRRRVYDAVVLKVLGATRRDVARAFLLEYGLLGLVTAALAAAIGTAAAYFFLTQAMRDGEWVFLPGVVVATALLGTAITLGLGFLGVWRALGAKAAPLLRNE